MKYINWIGIAAAIVLIIACFLPWTYYPDLDKTFTGFFTEKNVYGKPGKVLLVLAGTAIFLFSVPRQWAKRINIFFGAMTVAYTIKTYILFTACYRGFCPEKKVGIFLLLITSLVLLIASLLPEIRLREEGRE
ncbi:MAG TPA: hypothetical protein VGZ71_07400 [Puia sp.]|nr:hypothetical protein [Puia sp.]